MKSTLQLLLCLLIYCGAGAQSATKDTFRLYYLGGQSNMDGYGFNKDLSSDYLDGLDDVWIFHGNPTPDEQVPGGKGLWEKLRPGHGVSFSSDGMENRLSDRFGLELSLAKTLKEYYPLDNIAFIKYARGGTSIDSLAAAEYGSWDPDYVGETGINQYDHF